MAAWVLQYKGYVGFRRRLLCRISPPTSFYMFPLSLRDTLWVFELAMQLVSLSRAKSPMVNFSQHFDQVKVSALNGVCFSKKLSWWRQCTAPIINDELGLGPRVTLPESLLCDAAGSVWVWLSPNSAIISFNLSVMRLRLKDIEWLCPIHQIRRDEHVSWRHQARIRPASLTPYLTSSLLDWFYIHWD